MKKFILAIIIIFMPVTAISSDKQPTAPLDTNQKKLSYALGMDIGISMKKMLPDIDLQSLFLGITHAITDKDFLIGFKNAHEIKLDFANQSRNRIHKVDTAKDRLRNGLAFLEKNKTKDGVVTLKSGLQYQVLKSGQGNQPKPADTIFIHQKGSFINGKIFEDTHTENKPIRTPVIIMIQGLREGVMHMNPGSKYRFFLSPDLAFKDHYRGKEIKPNSTVIYDIELLSINSPFEYRANK